MSAHRGNRTLSGKVALFECVTMKTMPNLDGLREEEQLIFCNRGHSVLWWLMMTCWRRKRERARSGVEQAEVK